MGLFPIIEGQVMTEYELESLRQITIQSVMSTSDVLATHISIYLTIIFAYIAVAYIAGSKLTKLQLIITSAVFIAAALWELLMIITYSQSVVTLGAELLAANSEISPLFSNTARLWFSRVMWSSGMFAALIFMWSVRSSNNE
jgi:hypothetical protein